MHPAMEMTWNSWLEMHPETWVVSDQTGFDRNYEIHPYGEGILLTSEQRRLIQLLPTIGYPVGPGHLEATGQLPLNGQTLPAAMGVSVGYRLSWGGPGFRPRCS